MVQCVFLGHDVDWRKQGAPLQHILARKERFEADILNNLDKKNPYYNIPDYMEIEDKYKIRSTYFFRTIYENGNFMDYEDDIKELTKGGWEIGLHLDPSSVDDIEKIKSEKKLLETISRSRIRGNRVHYLRFNEMLPLKLQQLGFVYDSSVRNSKDIIDKDEMGFYRYGSLIEFPLTIMDAYLFTYMKVQEEQIIDTFKETLSLSRKINSEFNVITVNWHDNVLQMKGGRMYGRILEFLASQDDVEVCRGIDLANKINNLRNG